MKITCDIIKDLLPSYMDELLTEDSRKMVEEHLAACQCCKEYYETLKGEEDILADEAEALEEARLEEMKPLTKIKKKINRRTIIASFVSVVCAVAVLYGIYFMLFEYEFYKPYEEAGITVTESGKMYVDKNFHQSVGYSLDDEHIRFVFFMDTFITQHTERDEKKKETYDDDFSRTTGTITDNVAGEIVQEATYNDKVYYPPKEYAEKLMDRDFMVSMSQEERNIFYEEMKADSVLLWERPKFVKGEVDTMVSVRFTATVEAVIDDKNAGEGIPRYAVLKPFQAPPILVDVGLEFGKKLKVGETYSFKMKDQFVALITETYDVETVISLYDLEVESIDEPTDDQIGVNGVKVDYKKL